MVRGQRANSGQDAKVSSLLFFKGHHGIFNDHRESGPRFNISSVLLQFSFGQEIHKCFSCLERCLTRVAFSNERYKQLNHLLIKHCYRTQSHISVASAA